MIMSLVKKEVRFMVNHSTLSYSFPIAIISNGQLFVALHSIWFPNELIFV